MTPELKNIQIGVNRRKKLKKALAKVEHNGDAILKWGVAAFIAVLLLGIVWRNLPILLFIACVFLILILFSAVLFIIAKKRAEQIPNSLGSLIAAHIVKPNLKKYFTNVKCEYGNKTIIEKIKATKIFQNGLRFCVKSYISGVYDGRTFEISDVKIFKLTDFLYSTENGDRSKAFFDGTWITLDSPKEVISNHIVIRSISSSTKIDYAGLKQKMHQIKLESEEFNQNFAVFSEKDTSDAHYLLPPDIMENLIALNKDHDLSLCCYEGKMHIALNGIKYDALFGKSFADNFYEDEKQQETIIINDIKEIKKVLDNFIKDNNG